MHCHAMDFMKVKGSALLCASCACMLCVGLFCYLHYVSKNVCRFYYFGLQAGMACGAVEVSAVLSCLYLDWAVHTSSLTKARMLYSKYVMF